MKNQLRAIWEKIRASLVDDAHDFLKWWSTWVFIGLGVMGAIGTGIEYMPSAFRECLSGSVPRWVMVAITALGFIGPLVRMVKQPAKSDG